MELADMPDQQVAGEALEVESVVIEDALSFGVAGEISLEAAVEPEAVYHVRSQTATDGIGRFQEAKGNTALCQAPCTAKPGKPGSHDQHIRR